MIRKGGEDKMFRVCLAGHLFLLSPLVNLNPRLLAVVPLVGILALTLIGLLDFLCLETTILLNHEEIVPIAEDDEFGELGRSDANRGVSAVVAGATAPTSCCLTHQSGELEHSRSLSYEVLVVLGRIVSVPTFDHNAFLADDCVTDDIFVLGAELDEGGLCLTLRGRHGVRLPTTRFELALALLLDAVFAAATVVFPIRSTMISL